jgi:ribosomal protein S18 acetylase RimI-like enzyme
MAVDQDAEAHESRWQLRPCAPDDFDDVRDAHAVFPVDYENSFFQNVCRADSPLFTLRAAASNNRSQLAGVATARLILLSSANYNDRRCLMKHLRLTEAECSSVKALYLLTLAVRPPFRRQGLARLMLQKVKEV